MLDEPITRREIDARLPLRFGTPSEHGTQLQAARLGHDALPDRIEGLRCSHRIQSLQAIIVAYPKRDGRPTASLRQRRSRYEPGDVSTTPHDLLAQSIDRLRVRARKHCA